MNPNVMLAADDNISMYAGNSVDNSQYLSNDTYNGSSVPWGSSVNMVSTPNPGITIDYYNLNVADTVPAGNYDVVYQVCSNNTCSTATMHLTVNATEITAGDDTLDIQAGSSSVDHLKNDSYNGNIVDYVIFPFLVTLKSRVFC